MPFRYDPATSQTQFVPCARCGTVFKQFASRARRGKIKYCSQQCANLTITDGLRVPAEQRFWAKVEKTESCWLWTGAVDRAGYGRFRYIRPDRRGEATAASRMAWELAYGNHPCLRGPMPSFIQVCHRCDNPTCVRPDHAFRSQRCNCASHRLASDVDLGRMMQQSLVLDNFPRPSVARTISPNGRVHHMAKYHAVQAVQTHVKVIATMAGLRPMRGLVTLQATYVVPVARKRDQDNYTAILKSCIDALVRGGYLPDGDDTDHLRLLPVEIRVTKGMRMLVLEFADGDN